MYRHALFVVVGLLAAATVYEGLVAAGVIGMGSLPGEGPPGDEILSVAAAMALIGAAVLAAALSRRGKPLRLAGLLRLPRRRSSSCTFTPSMRTTCRR